MFSELLFAFLFQASGTPKSGSQEISGSVTAFLAWSSCVTQTANKYAATKENAETIADATLTSCGKEESNYQSEMAKVFGNMRGVSSLQANDYAWIDVRKSRLLFRQEAIAAVLEARTN